MEKPHTKVGTQEKSAAIALDTGWKNWSPAFSQHDPPSPDDKV